MSRPPQRPNDGDDRARSANEVRITESGQAVTGSSGADIFTVASAAVANAVITSFTLGDDVLRILDPVVRGHLSLSADADGVSTDLVFDAGSGAHTIAILKNVHADNLADVLGGQRDASLTEISGSHQTVAATPGADRFAFADTAQTGDVITGFTPGVDRLVLQNIDRSDVSLVPNPDGSSTDVVVTTKASGGGSSSHVLVTLQAVQVNDLAQVLGAPLAQPVTIELTGSNQTIIATDKDEIFLFTSLVQTGDTIVGFALGKDRLALADGLDRGRLTLSRDGDGASTDVVVDAGREGSHTLVRLAGVVAYDIEQIFIAPPPHGAVTHSTWAHIA